MRSVNKVIMVGHLAADPETRTTTTQGHTVTHFKLATNRGWKSADDERPVTDYHKIVAWRKLGEICARYLKKGSAIYMEGQLTNHKYVDKQGVERMSSEIIADVINFITYKKVNDGDEIQLVEVVEEGEKDSQPAEVVEKSSA